MHFFQSTATSASVYFYAVSGQRCSGSCNRSEVLSSWLLPSNWAILYDSSILHQDVAENSPEPLSCFPCTLPKIGLVGWRLATSSLPSLVPLSESTLNSETVEEKFSHAEVSALPGSWYRCRQRWPQHLQLSMVWYCGTYIGSQWHWPQLWYLFEICFQRTSLRITYCTRYV
jgi:hypothetical protein